MIRRRKNSHGDGRATTLVTIAGKRRRPDAPRLSGRRRGSPERTLHRSIVDLLVKTARKDVLWFHCPNGELRGGKTGAYLVGMGLRRGVPDLCFTLYDGRSAYMEIKTPGGRSTIEQLLWRDHCMLNSIPYALVCDMDNAIAALRSWRVLRNIRVSTDVSKLTEVGGTRS